MKHIYLESLCTSYTKNITLKETQVVGQYPVYGASGLAGFLASFELDKEYIGIIKDGAGIGRANKYPPFSSLLGTMQYIIPKENVSIDYLLYVIKALKLSTAFSGATIQHIYYKNYKKSLIKKHDFSKQKIIGEILSLIELLIKNKEKIIIKLDYLIKSQFIEMFGDVLYNSKGYDLVKYGSVFKLHAGGTPSKSVKEYWENGTISWIGSNLCQNKILYRNDGKYITEKGYKHSTTKLFPIDTVLIALVGATIGKTALLKFETTTNQNVLGISRILDAGYNPYFVYHYTQGLYNKFLNIGDGGFAMASKDFISKLEIAKVEINEQNKFSLITKQVNKSKFICQLTEKFLV